MVLVWGGDRQDSKPPFLRSELLSKESFASYFLRVLFLGSLSLPLLVAMPGRLGTGYVFSPNHSSRAAVDDREVDSNPHSLAASVPYVRPTSRSWEIVSDIVGDLVCGCEDTQWTGSDNGIRRGAEELGYTDRLSELECGGEDGTNILLLGIDRRRGRGRGRSDMIVLLRVAPNLGILTLSIPRDVKVPMRPGRPFGHQDKIAHMYVYGGVERTRRSVENLLGIKIDNYVVVENFSNFKRLLSLIRGVDIDKHLEGRIGLKWVRNRGFAHGDLERAMRSQIFIKAAIDKAWNLTDGGNQRLVNILARGCLLFVDTDLSLADILALVEKLRVAGFDPSTQIYMGHLRGRVTSSDSPALGLSYSLIEADSRLLKHLSKLFIDRKVIAECTPKRLLL